jgi:hypothetical protein
MNHFNCILHCLVVSLFVISCKREKSPEKENSTSSQDVSLTAASNSSPEFQRVFSFLKSYRRIESHDEKSQAFVSSKMQDAVAGLSAVELSQLIGTFDLNKEYEDLLVCSAMTALAAKDPALFIEYALKLGGNNYVVTNDLTLREAAKANPQVVIDWLKKGDFGERYSLRYTLAGDFVANLAPGDYLKQAELLLTRTEDRGDLLSTVYVKWASKNPSEALSHAVENLQGDEKTGAVFGILHTVSGSDPVAAYRMAETIDPTIIGPGIATLFGQLTQDHIDVAVSALKEMEPGRIQMVLERPGQAELIAENAPTVAIQSVSKLALTQTTVELYSRVALAVAKQDRKLAINWVDGFPESPSKQDILNRIQK